MGWFSPIICEDSCCTPICDPPETDPVVTCNRYVNAYGEFVDYEISNATEAWYVEIFWTGNPSDTPIHTQYPIELSEEGEASGTISVPEIPPINSLGYRYTYVIYAKNDCATKFCSDNCSYIYCQMDVSFLDGSVTNYLKIDYHYYSFLGYNIHPPFTPLSCNPETFIECHDIVSANINGIDVLSNANYEHGIYSGSMVIPTIDLEEGESIVLTIENECGRVKTCVYDPSCCNLKNNTVFIISGLGDHEESCEREDIDIYNQTHYHKKDFSITGLSAFNGTYLVDTGGGFFLEAAGCGVKDNTFPLDGEILIKDNYYYSGYFMTGFPIQPYVYSIEQTFGGKPSFRSNWDFGLVGHLGWTSSYLITKTTYKLGSSPVVTTMNSGYYFPTLPNFHSKIRSVSTRFLSPGDCGEGDYGPNSKFHNVVITQRGGSGLDPDDDDGDIKPLCDNFVPPQAPRPYGSGSNFPISACDICGTNFVDAVQVYYE
jgi:hypothetical protein